MRIIVLRKVGFEATGLYQSAWTLGGLYVGFILQAMGADFYPRLTASIQDNEECNRLVNEQTLVGLLLAGPGVLATLTFAPLVIALFYSREIRCCGWNPALDLPGSHAAGDHLADGLHHRGQRQARLFFFSELAWTIVAVSLAWVCVELLRIERRGHRVLWILCLSRIPDIPDRASAQWLSMVHGEQADHPAVPPVDRGSVPFVSRVAVTFVRLPRYISGHFERCILDAGPSAAYLPDALVKRRLYQIRHCFRNLPRVCLTHASGDRKSRNPNSPEINMEAMNTTTPNMVRSKPKLAFFAFRYDNRLPEFIVTHHREHVRCLSEFFEVTVVNQDCDYREICDKYTPDIAVFESGQNIFDVSQTPGKKRPFFSSSPEDRPLQCGRMERNPVRHSFRHGTVGYRHFLLSPLLQLNTCRR